MTKNFFVYLLTILLLASVAIPSYYSITEEICESSLAMDIEEDAENSENSEKNEIKIIEFSNEFSSSYTLPCRDEKNTYISNKYNSISRSLESPPPEFS
ncbi:MULTISPECIES: hypothetical protein [unclassified Tenacibaculum]|uniref:hypothetical protein n=1 Tax=unclassified Tenacibaculum TaxID=2635139 RepID=UPI001F15CF31|nr:MULTISPECIES: hypothetical protein [unclassified Tenacibaculum]MCF2875963.1 hypothetical protein [Tenacibaculum sp. Cn5-1]MCF2936038.1 hypothetical protein [Tenacibaculum sp. Cn5-34]MCG7512599.1 hypothetical protein [Tenacibaculum sp. Cn5-46]